MRYLFDIESNGLLDTITKIHCISIKDLDTLENTLYVGPMVNHAIGLLSKATLLVGHNIIRYDLPAIQKLFPSFSHQGITKHDTRIMSRMAKPKWFEHSLAAWGRTLRFAKGDYSDKFKEDHPDYQDGDEWLVYSDDMGSYCQRDVELNYKVYQQCCKGYGFFFSEESLQLETEVTELMNIQQSFGVAFNQEGALPLALAMKKRQDELRAQLSKTFTGFYKRGSEFIPKTNSKKYGYVKGSPMTKIIWTEFNPNSREHIAYWFKRAYNWVPEDFTPGGDPQINEVILEELEVAIPESVLLIEYMMLEKRVSAIYSADGSWLNSIDSNSRIHGSVNPQGCRTYRASHSGPNLGQIPKCTSPYGKECRELFSHGYGDEFTLMGTDMSAIELRLLAHYLFKFDNGTFKDIVLEGDIHTSNQKAAKLDTRDQAKTFIYAFIYGAGDGKLGAIAGKDRAYGSRLRANFIETYPAIRILLSRLKVYASKNSGYIRGLDGRHIPMASERTLLNYLLQSAGAILSKEWIVQFHKLMKEAGFIHGRDYYQLLWVHDEIQVAIKKAHAKQIQEISIRAIQIAGEIHNLNCPITGESKTGDTWADTH